MGNLFYDEKPGTSVGPSYDLPFPVGTLVEHYTDSDSRYLQEWNGLRGRVAGMFHGLVVLEPVRTGHRHDGDGLDEGGTVKFNRENLRVVGGQNG